MEIMQNKWFITTSIPYLNAPPHIGFALEAIQADVLARYHRQSGEHVFFLSGTDEHGAKISRAAAAAQQTPQAFVDSLAEHFQRLQPSLNLSYDEFIRTSDQKQHWPVAQELWKRLAEAGDIYKKTYEGLYCVGHEAFVTHKDLADGVCTIHKKAPEHISEENYFFRLSKYGPAIQKAIESNEVLILPETRRNEVLSFVKEGAEDISFSRPRKDLEWGIPVPDDNSQTIYVWADALSNYISGYGGIEHWSAHPADAHVIGKDILRFHAVIWLGMLLAAKLPLPKAIYVHGFVTVNGEKMSKSLGNVIDPFSLVETYGSDATRYFLLREIPSGEDGDFSYEKFKERYNGDLANGLGNVVARVATLGEKISPLTFDIQAIPHIDIRKSITEFRLNEALEHIWAEIRSLDKTINDERPWEKDGEALHASIIKYSGIIISFAEALLPFLPSAAETIRESFSVNNSLLTIKKGGNLFPRLK